MKLTAREQWWKEGVISGRTNRQLAEDAGISIRTVETYGLRWAQKAGVPKLGRVQGSLREAVLRAELEERK